MEKLDESVVEATNEELREEAMKLLSNEQVALLQSGMQNFSRIVGSADHALITQYIKEATPQWKGEVDDTLLRAMSAQDLVKAKLTIKLFCDLGEHVLQCQKIITTFQEEHNAAEKETPTDVEVPESNDSDGVDSGAEA